MVQLATQRDLFPINVPTLPTSPSGINASVRLLELKNALVRSGRYDAESAARITEEVRSKLDTISSTEWASIVASATNGTLTLEGLQNMLNSDRGPLAPVPQQPGQLAPTPGGVMRLDELRQMIDGVFEQSGGRPHTSAGAKTPSEVLGQMLTEADMHKLSPGEISQLQELVRSFSEGKAGALMSFKEEAQLRDAIRVYLANGENASPSAGAGWGNRVTSVTSAGQGSEHAASVEKLKSLDVSTLTQSQINELLGAIERQASDSGGISAQELKSIIDKYNHMYWENKPQ